jgi:hypothetical protein
LISGLYPLGDRLNFVLPDFIRLSWVGDHAREIWAPRFKRIVVAWSVMERESVLHGLRKCALEKRTGHNEINADASTSQKVVTLKLGNRMNGVSAESSASTESSGKDSAHFAIADSACVEEFRNAWLVQDHDKIGSLLGYPPCCTLAFCERYAAADLSDPIWQVSSASRPAKERQINIGSGAPSCNIFWRLLGIRAVPHLPCSFDCAGTVAVGRKFFDLAGQLGFTAEIEWLMQVLSWPVEWSALHGIAEIKTPIVKICTATDATARKLIVHWTGNGYPSEGAQAIRFPYQVPHRLSVTDSPAYQRGLDHSRLVNILPDKVPSS